MVTILGQFMSIQISTHIDIETKQQFDKICQIPKRYIHPHTKFTNLYFLLSGNAAT